jgi:FkbM family methyltransferase
VVVDVGVQGGTHPRWELLGDHLIIHGFDAISEVVDELKGRNAGQSNRHFYNIAIGDSDEERSFYFNAADPSSSSMHKRELDRITLELDQQIRVVTSRRLDSLLAASVIPKCDFLKVDVEGFEKEVFVGANEFLAAGVLGVETETNFGISPTYPKTHFVTLMELLLAHRLLIFDIAFNRAPRESFLRTLRSNGLELQTLENGRSVEVGKPATVNVLFFRDLIDELDRSQNYTKAYAPARTDQIIKSIIICELYGLNDIALDTTERFADQLGARLDVECAMRLLADDQCSESAAMHRGIQGIQVLIDQSERENEVFRRRIYELQSAVDLLVGDAAVIHRVNLEQQIRQMEQSTSWRITAPLRALKRIIGGQQ